MPEVVAFGIEQHLGHPPGALARFPDLRPVRLTRLGRGRALLDFRPIMTSKAQSTALRTEVPTRLLAELQALVDAGWSPTLDEVVLDALRRYADSHRQELMEEHIREDIEWGLRGSD